MWGLRHYVVLWTVTTFVMIREYLILNHVTKGASLLAWAVSRGLLPGVDKLSPKAGQPLSFMLGWLGFGIICMTNFYVFRKRSRRQIKQGTMGRWLDFHIFCGLLGPTLIIFHTNFKVGGLVAVSFWSMMVSFVSGIVGRYFYVQLITRRVELKSDLKEYEARFQQVRAVMKPPMSAEDMQLLKRSVVARAGVTEAIRTGRADTFTVLMATVLGDLKLMLEPIPLPSGTPAVLGKHLRTYAITKRRVITDKYFQLLMGYWHSFHLPFAIFMYVVTVIHVISALVFRVDH